jgi:hypothetical protein
VYGREFPSVWEALDYSVRLLDARLAEGLGEQKTAIEGLESKKEAVAKELKEWKEAVSQGFQDVDRFMAGELDTLHCTQKSLETRLNGKGPGVRARIQSGVLFARTSWNEEGEDESESKSRDDKVQEDSFWDLRARMLNLEVSVKSHPGGGGGGDGPPAFGNLGLSGVGDLAAWNLDQGSGFQFGLFVDGPALLTFKREDFVSVGDQLAGLKRAGDISLNQMQVRVLASFQNTLPEFFGKGVESDGSSLPALPKLTDWEAEDGINGAKFCLEQALSLIQKQLSTYIILLEMARGVLKGGERRDSSTGVRHAANLS